MILKLQISSIAFGKFNVFALTLLCREYVFYLVTFPIQILGTNKKRFLTFRNTLVLLTFVKEGIYSYSHTQSLKHTHTQHSYSHYTYVHKLLRTFSLLASLSVPLCCNLFLSLPFSPSPPLTQAHTHIYTHESTMKGK